MTRTKLIGAFGALAVVTAALTMGAASTGESSDRQLVGMFADASPLEPGSEVRLQGVRIGTIDDIKLEDGTARVTVDLDATSLPLHTDARMTVKPVNLLGEFYIEVSPGTDSKPMLGDGVIPVTQTTSTVTIQQVLDTLDDPTSSALAAMITGLGEGMDDSGAEAAAALQALAPAMRDAARLGRVLSDQNDVLTQLLDHARPVAGALAQRNGKVLDQVVASTQRMLAAVAAEQEAADATLAELPSTLIAARRTMTRLAGVSDATVPTLQALRPVTDDLEQITSELYRFADSADPALASLQPVLDRANALMDRAAPVVAQLRAAGVGLRATAARLRPLGDQLLDQHLGDLMDFVRKWSLSTNGKDALSHYFRGVFHVTPNTLSDLAASMLPKTEPLGGASAGSPPLIPGLDVPNLLGNLGLGNLGLDQSLQNLGLGGLLGQSKPTDGDSATGLSPQQEQSLLGQLLGGG